MILKTEQQLIEYAKDLPFDLYSCFNYYSKALDGTECSVTLYGKLFNSLTISQKAFLKVALAGAESKGYDEF